MPKRSKRNLSYRKIDLYKKNSRIIKFWRRNPIIACEDLLGIKLLDYQKYILQQSWNTPMVLWACSRSAGKSFLGAIIIILKAILYENQSIYICAPVGNQSKELFTKCEEIILNLGKTAASIDSLKDIVKQETVKSAACTTGFSHAQTGFEVEFYNGSAIHSLNGNPDNTRSKRASLVFFDESGFMSENAIAIMEAFAAQDSNFKTSTEKSFNIKAQRKKCPTQLIYASSASDVDTTFFRHYKEFAKEMFLGNTKNYFCCDISCEIPLHPTMDGKLYPPLLTQEKVDSAMKADPMKAEREYFNHFTKDGGVNQIVKWGTIRRNETFILPEVCYTDGSLYAIFVDPSRTNDNSIILIMKIKFNENIGYYGEFVNCINMIDIDSKKKYKLPTPEQVKILKNTILTYNGNNSDYKNIKRLSIDPGAGGGGVNAFGDNMLDDWVDNKGIRHKGFLDNSYEIYEGFEKKYPNASNILRFYSPQKFRTQMVDEFIELIGQDLLKFPKEYSGRGYVTLEKLEGKEIKLYEKKLSLEEENALINLDILKTEITSIYKYENAEKTSKTYKLPKDKENKVHDDRFYCCIMASHFLYELRRQNIIKSKISKVDYSKLSCVSNVSLF